MIGGAWASRVGVSVLVVIGAVRIAWPWTRGYARDGADFKLGGVRGCGIRVGIAGPGARDSRFCRRIRRFVAPCLRAPAAARTVRSEEQTSELQSLMRISSAVFCLKKKKTRVS